MLAIFEETSHSEVFRLQVMLNFKFYFFWLLLQTSSYKQKFTKWADAEKNSVAVYDVVKEFSIEMKKKFMGAEIDSTLKTCFMSVKIVSWLPIKHKSKLKLTNKNWESGNCSKISFPILEHFFFCQSPPSLCFNGSWNKTSTFPPPLIVLLMVVMY